LRCEHPVRLAAGRARVDRGDALYLADAPAEGFLCERRGDFYALTPGDKLIAAFCEWVRPWAIGDPLARSLTGLTGVEDADRRLLIEGIKRIDLGAGGAALCAYERRVRQRAALCMRTKRGGELLSDCAACLAIARQGLTKQ
jgi:hypothetical protein